MYEAMFIFGSSTTDENMVKIFASVREEVEKLEGTTEAINNLGRRQFARPMMKRESGVYVKMPFTMAPGNINALRGRLKMNADILRVQITKQEKKIEKPESVTKEAVSDG